MKDLSVVKETPEDLLLRFGLTPKAPPVIDASMLSTFMDCPSKFYLRYVLGLRPKRKDPTKDGNLDCGTCWHETMFAFMEAADESKRRGGISVKLSDVLQQARRQAATRIPMVTSPPK